MGHYSIGYLILLCDIICYIINNYSFIADTGLGDKSAFEIWAAALERYICSPNFASLLLFLAKRLNQKVRVNPGIVLW